MLPKMLGAKPLADEIVQRWTNRDPRTMSPDEFTLLNVLLQIEGLTECIGSAAGGDDRQRAAFGSMERPRVSDLGTCFSAGAGLRGR